MERKSALLTGLLGTALLSGGIGMFSDTRLRSPQMRQSASPSLPLNKKQAKAGKKSKAASKARNKHHN